MDVEKVESKGYQTDFLTVTELAGDDVSHEQIQRLCDRYYWAGRMAPNLDVVEVACGTGQGLGYLASLARSLVAGDVSEAMIQKAKAHYGDRIDLRVFDASRMPFEDASKDVIILFEALYYLPDIDRFFFECKRVLRPGGRLLMTTANKDLYDFNPSPYSFEYLGVAELSRRLSLAGFSARCFGGFPVSSVSLRQKALRPIKKAAVAMGLVPKTMAGKKLLKKLVFGGLKKMPAEIDQFTSEFNQPVELDPTVANKSFKVIYCEAVNGRLS